MGLLCTAGLFCTVQLSAQTGLHVDHGNAEQPAKHLQPAPATQNVSASFHAALPQADPRHRGEAWFTLQAVYADPATHATTPVTIRIPISSTEYPYGEERSCDRTDPAHPQLTFSAGLDEKNYIAWRSSNEPLHAFEFSLNKYLCRVLAAPFHCGGQPVRLSNDLSRWMLAPTAALTLSADGPATLRSTPVQLTGAGSFDIAQCAVIAPSGGLCCVQGKTTEWHCGGTPAGEGWHQVSGECFHRETGSACKD